MIIYFDLIHLIFTQVRSLSHAALLEHNKQQYLQPGGVRPGVGGEQDRVRRHGRASLHTKPPYIPSKESSSDKEDQDTSHSSPNSLVGTNLSHRAYNVTQRLSRSLYMTAIVQSHKDSQGDHMPNDKTISLVYQNSYQLPDEQCHFRSGEVRRITEDVLNNFLSGREYKAAEASRLSCQLSTLVKGKMKDLNMPRYKFVCQVILGQKDGQSCEMATKCLWDEARDNYACASYENQNLYAVALVHGVYFE